MFFIAYKSDGITACKKQINLSRLTEVGKTKSNATLYCTPSTENDGAPYRWFYTVEGIPDLLDRANISPYAEPEQIRTILDGISESQAAQAFPDANAKLEQIKLAIVNKDWTSKKDEHYYGENIGGWASVTPDEAFIKGMLFHPFEELYHMSEKFRKMLDTAIEEAKKHENDT